MTDDMLRALWDKESLSEVQRAKAVRPPSMIQLAPVTYVLSGPHSHTITAAAWSAG